MNTKEQENYGKATLQAFIASIIKSRKAKKPLLVNISNFSLFDELSTPNLTQISSLEELSDNLKFDFILGDFPFGMYQKEWRDEITNKIIKAPQNWLEILKSIYKLTEDGLGMFLVEPHGLNNKQGQKFQKELNAKGFYVNAIFNVPEKILLPLTAIRPVLISISKGNHPKFFLAELNEPNQATQAAKNFVFGIDKENLADGTLLNKGEFVSFHRLKIQQQIERLETQYKEYEKHILSDITNEIKSVRSGETFQEVENAVYIPKIGKSEVVSNLNNARLKHHNYFQVVLNETVLNEYVASFFESALGKLILDSLTMQSFIPHVNKQDIEQAFIALPNIEEQKSIVQTQHKLRELKTVIENFNKEIALNPNTSIQGQLDRMLEAITVLTDADKIRAIVREGESKNIEFKETLSLDIRKQTKESYIEQSALKTIVAFLNTEGGVLLIGVSDDGKINGVEAEIEKFHKNIDKFLLHFKNLLKSKIGEAFYPFIDNRLVKLDNIHVLLVECKASQSPCYLEGKEFFVRTNPATDKLEGPKLVEYVQHHFGTLKSH